MSGTTFLQLTAQQFANRLGQLIPAGWAGADAIQRGVASSLLLSLAGGMETVLKELVYTAAATRLTTSTSPELDEASVDFLGNSLPRPAGMSDSAFAALIVNSLFSTAATRSAIAAALTRLTGFPPRMMEPWNIFDTGVWDHNSYWDVDTPANPARWGSPDSIYQGFIETVAPSVPAIGANNPIYCWDSGPLGPYWDVPGYFFGEIGIGSLTSVDDLVAKVKAEGTTVWVKIVAPSAIHAPILPNRPTALQLTAVDYQTVSVSWAGSTVGDTPIQYVVQYRVHGTTPWLTGPLTSQLQASLAPLSPFTYYDVQVVAKNAGGSAISDFGVIQTLKQAPSKVTNLTASLVQATAITLVWSAPATGTPPFSYVVQYKVDGTTVWNNFSVGVGTIGVTIINLLPNTLYDFQVIASTT